MKRLASLLAIMTISSSAFAAGIDSRAYTCTALHALIAAKGFVFIGNPDFEDFVVANASFCSGGQIPQERSVVTRDSPGCQVNYCTVASPPEGRPLIAASASGAARAAGSVTPSREHKNPWGVCGGAGR